MTAGQIHTSFNAGRGRRPSREEGAALTRRAALLSVGSALLLALFKVAGWLASGSVALLASLADSSLDVFAALATFAAVRYAARPPDEDHRYGRGKVEALSGLLQATLIVTSAALVGSDAVGRLIRPEPIRTGAAAIAIMLISTAVVTAVIVAQTRILAKARSIAVFGDRAHHLADVGANLAALAGITVAAVLHWPRADAVAALLVAAWLIWNGIGVLRKASASLMDRELDKASRAAIVKLVLEEPEISNPHDLRTRASGPFIHVQMHVDIDPGKTLDQVHQILGRAERRLLEHFPEADVLILPDPRGHADPRGGVFSAVNKG